MMYCERCDKLGFDKCHCQKSQKKMTDQQWSIHCQNTYEIAAAKLVANGAIRVNVDGRIYPAVFALPDRLLYLCRQLGEDYWYPSTLALDVLNPEGVDWAKGLMKQAKEVQDG